MTITHATEIGCVSPNNEDCYLSIKPHIYAVADGMGGHDAGEVASRMMIDSVKQYLEHANPDDCNEECYEQSFLRAMKKLCELLRKIPSIMAWERQLVYFTFIMAMPLGHM